jgi:hypothetical protein
MFSNAEYADIHFVYGFCNGNAEAAVREYRHRFPGRRVPYRGVFIQTHRRFREFGINRNNEQNRQVNRRVDIRILRAFDANPHLSHRKAAQQLNVSNSFVLRTLHRDNRKAYHMQPVQELHPGDAERRLNFCQWVLNVANEDPDVLRKILWTDEATFTRTGIRSFHNLYVWDHENPHEIRPRSFQREFSVNVWLSVVYRNICGPHFFPGRLNSELFCNFLENSLPEIVEDVPLQQRYHGWIQMDGAPAHCGRVVREWLNRHYPQRWIGRSGPVLWPPRSPDLNPMDYYVWGALKQKVYIRPVLTRDNLLERIITSCEELRQNPHQISNAVQSLIRRCEKCIEAGGLHFEQLI